MGLIHALAQYAHEVGDMDLLYIASDSLFALEPKWHRFPQRRATRQWLDLIDGEGANTVARVLAAHPEAVAWYLEEKWKPSPRSDRIRGVLTAPTA